MIISMIAAVAANRVIGRNGDLPWHLPADLQFFSQTTKGHHVLMGRKNYDSLPPKYRPLPNRTNIVITNNPDFIADSSVVIVNSVGEAIQKAKRNKEVELFIIGGGQVYERCLPLADKLYITHVDGEVDGDTLFPKVNWDTWKCEVLFTHEKDSVHSHGFKTCLYTR